MRLGSVVFLTVVLYCTAFAAPESGTIRGRVFDESGHPIRGASINILGKGSHVGHRPIRNFETTGDGSFEVLSVPFGTYVVVGSKESDGYPDQKLAFYSNLNVPTVTVTPEAPLATVRVTLGPKAARIQLGKSLDTITGRVVESATITLKRVWNPSFFITTSATTSSLEVPADVDLTCEISAPGYLTYLCNPAPGHVIRLGSKDTFEVIPRLRPQDDRR